MPLVSPFKKVPVTLPLSAFTQSFQNDIAKWVKQVTEEDSDDDDAPAIPLRVNTVESRVFQIRQFASALVAKSVLPIDQIKCVADLFTPDRFKAGLRWFRERPHGKDSLRLYHLAGALFHIAKHYCKVDEAYLVAMAALRKKLDPHVPRQMSARTREQVRQFDDKQNVVRLLRFDKDQVEHARHEKKPFRAAKRVERALAVTLMIHGGLRQATLRKLHITGDFSWTRPNHEGVCHLHVPGEKIKNRRRADRQLPPSAAYILKLYLTIH